MTARQWIFGAVALAIAACAVAFTLVGETRYALFPALAAVLAVTGMIAYEFVSAKREHRNMRWRKPSRPEVAFLAVVATTIALGTLDHWGGG
ncbi:MAG: hypothetical protein OXH09_08770 [Gammaproteobacteria bacterium]|nr:hypothetical protein [Gammaproteobacteria bacterium]